MVGKMVAITDPITPRRLMPGALWSAKCEDAGFGTLMYEGVVDFRPRIHDY